MGRGFGEGSRGEEPTLQWETRVWGLGCSGWGRGWADPRVARGRREGPAALLGPAPAPARLLFKRLPPSLSSRSRRCSLVPRLPYLPGSARFSWPPRYVPPRPAVSDPQTGADPHFPPRSPPQGCHMRCPARRPRPGYASERRRRAGGECVWISSSRVVRHAGDRGGLSRSGSLGFRPLLPPALLVPDHTVCICHSQNFLSPPRSPSWGPGSISPPLLYRCKWFHRLQ